MASIADTAAIQRPARRRRSLEFGVALALAWLILVVALAIFAPYVGVQNPDEGDLLDVLSLPTAAHWLGTDSLGRDTLARAVYGAQVSLTVALGSVGIGLAFGGTLGLVGGYFGRWPDRVIMGTMTVLLCFPGIGQMLVNAVYQHDHFAIQGVVLIVATGFVLINLAVDLAYALLDPRVRHGVDS